MNQPAQAGYEIVARQDFSDVTFLLEVRHPMLAKAARAGQFVIVMASEHGERIPLTIADYDRDKGTITLVIQAVGKTTREMQRGLKAGDRLVAPVGPRFCAWAADSASRRSSRRRAPGRKAART
jgi:sulfide dehydrogenase subunit beta